jgi:aminopeptidase YwaD
MDKESLYHNCDTYLQKLCVEIPGRSVASPGNREATRFFEGTLAELGWDVETHEFDAIDWQDGGASLQAGGMPFEVLVSPYAPGCQVTGELVSVPDVETLESADISGKIAFLHGQIAGEQLMPKNFVFYNPEEHQRIIALLEQKQPVAIVCATGRNSSLAGGAYPFPLIEDGDFEIPSVYMTEEEGARLLQHAGSTVNLFSNSRRIPGKAYNVTGRKGDISDKRLVVTAHIDAKKGTPGAIDNATGVIVLLLLAELLQDYNGCLQVELVAFNGEDYYAAPGQMLFLRQNQDRFDEILLNINIDGVGYREGLTAFSFYGLPPEIETVAREILRLSEGITEGSQWPQGDHSIFIQMGCPALAVSSDWLIEHMDSQDITHTPKDNPGIVDCRRLVEAARALDYFVRRIPNKPING